MQNRTASWLAATLLLTSGTAAAETAITADVVYGHKDGMALTYDVLQPQDSNGAGVLFMVSGGWFSRWAPPERRVPRFEHLLNAGFTVITVRHGSAPRFKVPDAVADVRRAVEHVRDNASTFGLDADRLGVHGGSAGGHLSLMLGLDAQDGNTVAAVVAYFPPVDLVDSVGPSERFPALDFDPELAPEVSPINFASADDPPVLMIHGTEDRLVPLRHSERMSAALDEAGAPNEVLVIDGAAHGFRGEHQQTAAAATVAFFTEHLAEGD